jgi:integrase
MPERRRFGQARQLRSGRWQARWMLAGQWHTARRVDDDNRDLGPLTFTTRRKAEDHLSWVSREIEAGRWKPPHSLAGKESTVPTLREYAAAWLAERDLEATTREHYRHLLDDHILPTLGDIFISEIVPAMVRSWHANLARASGTGRSKVPDRPTARAHAYGLLRTICNTAVAEEVIAANPCRIRGAGQAKRVKQIRPASLAELEALVRAMPQRYRLLVLLASWCGLRFGELAELRRSDVDVTNAVIHVRRGVVRTKDGRVVKGPKSDAGRRDVSIPPHLMDAVKAHLRKNSSGRDDLLFPARHGGHLAPATLYRVFYPARNAAGRPDLRFHDLRHTGAVLAAQTGAGLADLMSRLGHSTPAAAMRYQHAARDEDRKIAAALSDLAAAAGNVVPIDTKRKRKEAG